MNNRTKLLGKAAGAFGLSLIPFLLLLGFFTLTLSLPNLSAVLFLLSPAVCFLSGLTLAMTSVDSKARIALASSVTSMGFILVGMIYGWFRGREIIAVLLYLFFFFVLLIGIRREATIDGASAGSTYLKWGLGLTVIGLPLCIIPPIGVIALSLGAFCFYFGVLQWALELFAAARKASDVDQDALAL